MRLGERDARRTGKKAGDEEKRKRGHNLCWLIVSRGFLRFCFVSFLISCFVFPLGDCYY